jgi:5'-nucleotidase
MDILITNDDGIHAEGLAALAEAARTLPGARVTIVAPAHEHSQCGHRVTTHQPLHTRRAQEGAFTVDGTPADCVRVALFGLHLKPSLVLSGVNHGGNMGQDLMISGTVAAVREAAYHGVPAVAFSHYLIRDIALDWARTSRWAARLLRDLALEDLKPGEFWNVNFPHHPPGEMTPPEVVECPPARSPLRVSFEKCELADGGAAFHYSASYAQRPRDPGSDVEACFGGKIAVSRLRV